MSVLLESTDTVVTARLSGEIDHHQAQGLRQRIDDMIQRQKPSRVVLDFGEVTFMDSSGIGLIMGRYKTMQGIGGTVEVVNVPASMRKVMQLAGLEQIVTVKGEEKE